MTVRNTPGGTLITGDHIPIARLIALKGAVKLEGLGMRHSSGKSMRKHAARLLGISPHSSTDDVVGALVKRIAELSKVAQ
jgi:hypothetical protein